MKILGFDIGIASIGWAFVESGELKDCGVRIFTEAENPKDGKSLALPRREARSVRRRLMRRKNRLETLKQLLAKEWGLCYEDYIAADGVLPKAFVGKNLTNPYQLRYEALQRILSKEEFARVILHIAKHRGYGNKNAKTTKSEEGKKEEGKIKAALQENSAKLAKYRTIGEYFYKEFCEVVATNHSNENLTQAKVRILKPIRNKGGEYTNCVAQEDLQRELQLIFECQRGFGFPITQEFQDKILKIAFHQRPLKDFSHLVGKCTFYPDEPRAPKFSLSAIEFVTISRVINLLQGIAKESGEVWEKAQWRERLDLVFGAVCEKGSVSFAQVRKILRIDERIRFKEVDYTAKNPEGKKLIEFKNLKKFCEILGAVKGERALVDSVAADITLIKDEEKLAQKLRGYGKFSQEQITQLSILDFSHHINLSLKALGEILPLMREGVRYDEACKLAGLKAKHNEQKSKFLPPFCESIYASELTNPVVHRAIAEYRKVLNALIKKYGRFHKIHIELTREVGKSHKERERYKKEIEDNYQKRQQAIRECETMGLNPSEGNILKMRLFREQGEVCAYSGKKITREDLLSEKALEIDHILPYSRSCDDSYNNKVLVFIQQNQNKGNKTPFEAFGGDNEKWAGIESLALRSGYPKKKARRILERRFSDREAGFKERNIVDSGYIARLIGQFTREYLAFLPLDSNENTALIAGEKGSKVHVGVVSGMLTSTMRHFWGLPIKNRDEHTHHAIDAIIIAFINAAMIKRFSDFKQEQETLKAKLYAKELAKEEFKKQRAFFEPSSGFREKVLAKVEQIFVSRPPRKRARGALHEETFYAFDDEKLLKTYGGKEGVKRALELGKIRRIGTKIVANGEMKRVDIFRHTQSGRFYAVPIYTMDFALGVLPNKAVVGGKEKSGIIKDWLEMDSNYEFCFSLYKDDVIRVQKKDMQEAEFGYFVSLGTATASIAIMKHDNKFENLTPSQVKLFSSAKEGRVVVESLGIQNLKVLEKYKVSPLGELKPAKYEPREPIALKTTPKSKRQATTQERGENGL